MPPYRDPPREELVAMAPRHRPRRLWIWVPAIVGSAVAIALGAGELMVFPLAVSGFLSVAVQTFARRGAYARLDRLPFPVVHDPPLGAAADSPQGRPIALVEVHLREPLDGPEAERIGVRVAATAPELSVLIDGDRIALTKWSWGEQDAVQLANLLATWATELHGTHPIREVAVTWAPGGPRPSM